MCKRIKNINDIKINDYLNIIFLPKFNDIKGKVIGIKKDELTVYVEELNKSFNYTALSLFKDCIIIKH